MLSVEYLSIGCFSVGVFEGYEVDVRFREAGGLGYSRLPQEMTRSGSLSHNLVS